MHDKTNPPHAQKSQPSPDEMQQARGLWPVLLATAMSSLLFYGVLALLTLLLTERLGMSEAAAMTRYGWVGWGRYLFLLPAGILVDRVLGARRAVILGYLGLGLGCALLGVSRQAVVEVGLVLFVAGAGLSRAGLAPLLGEQYLPHSRRMGGGFWAMGVAMQLGAIPSGLLADIVRTSFGFECVFLGYALLSAGTAAGLWLLRRRLLPAVSEARSLPPETSTGNGPLFHLAGLLLVCALAQWASQKAVAALVLSPIERLPMSMLGWFSGWTVYRALRTERVTVSLWARVAMGVLLLAPLGLALWWQPQNEALLLWTQRGAWLAGGMIDVLLLPTVCEAAMRWCPRAPATAISVMRLCAR